MLAYVFWHAAPARIAAADYEKTLLRFGNALADAGSPGFQGHASYAIGQTPWLGEPGYEDWVWLEGSWALDPLNEHAVSGVMEQPHDEIAQMTKHGGHGALYYLVAGEHNIPGNSRVFWLSRPRGIKWREVLSGIVDSMGPNDSKIGVWRRQMVLGPATEFAVIAPPDASGPVLPDGWTSVAVDRRKLEQP
jgi:hypothetical protein